MPRDECRDCERPVTAKAADLDGRCSSCHIDFLDRQGAPKKKGARKADEEEEE